MGELTPWQPDRAVVAAELERLAGETGDAAFLRAAQSLFQQPPGRPAINDEAALREADFLIESGRARSMRDALMRVARARSMHGNLRSIYDRLRRKAAGRKNRAAE